MLGRMSDSPLSRPSRRRFLQIIGIGLAAPSVLSKAACGDDGEAKIKDGTAYFPESVASGDPRADSVVLWARIADAKAGDEADVTLVVATDEALTNVVAERPLTVLREYDHIAKVKVTGLTAGTVYYYRFVYERGSSRFASRTGRTKTAPAASADVTVKLAVASCQDFIGRYFHSYTKMLDVVDELDVVVHIGDYIYETTGDAFFQSDPTDTRRVVFSDSDGAIAFKSFSGETTHFAAQSLSNYRELYRTYRSDKALQAVHERVPFIFIWDDHEFSDDCWGDTATYFDGRVDEDHETQRRRSCERANFEYLPTESGLGPDSESFDALATKTPINDASVVIYRDYRFGKHVHLVLSDTRTYRPDHLIPEDVNPSRVALDQAQLVARGLDPQREVGDPPAPFYAPYIDLETFQGGSYQAPLSTALTTLYTAQLPGASAEAVAALVAKQATGKWSAQAINIRLKALIDAGTITAIDLGPLERGATFDNLRFSAGQLFAKDGVHARYLVEREHFQAYAQTRWEEDPASQDLFGPTQTAWINTTLGASDATWRIFTSSISLTEMTVDARAESFPPALEGRPDTQSIKDGIATFSALLKTPYLLSVDQWDGFPQKRDTLLAALRQKPNSIIVSGDIHSFYATNHGKGSAANGVVELTCGGISSESFKGFVHGVVNGLVPGIADQPTVASTIENLEAFLQYNFPQMTFADNDGAGFIVLSVGASEASATYYIAPVDHVLEDLDEAAAKAAYVAIEFGIKDGVLTQKA